MRDIDILLDRIKDIQDRLIVIEASLSTGQQSYDSVIVAANYSHVHRRSSILDLDDDSDIDHGGLTGLTDEDHSLSAIANTTGDKTFTFANKGIKFKYTGVNPGAYDGMFELEMTGNLQADVIHVHQHTGNVVAGSKLLHLHGEDADLLELEISGQGPVLSIQDTGDSDEELLEFDTTARTLRIGAADGDDDVAVSIYGQIVAFDGFGAIDVNFANGTTYKVEADGDAILKDITANTLLLGDNNFLRIGALASGDLRIWHDGANSYIRNYTGTLNIDSDVSLLFLQSSTSYVHVSSAANQHMYFDAGGTFYFRDRDAAGANRVTISSSGGEITTTGFVDATAGFKDNGVAGVDGTFEDNNGNTITVSGGIITNLTT